LSKQTQKVKPQISQATTSSTSPVLYQAATDLLSQHGWDVAIGRLEMMVEVLKEERQVGYSPAPRTNRPMI